MISLTGVDSLFGKIYSKQFCHATNLKVLYLQDIFRAFFWTAPSNTLNQTKFQIWTAVLAPSFAV